MNLRELSIEEFNSFTNKHPLSNYCQTINYALFMGEYNFDYELIGLFKKDKLIAASLILFKDLKGLTYGYAPKGFLIDYKDINLLERFTEKIIEHYYEKQVVFIKVNPEIPIGKIDPVTKEIKYNSNRSVKNLLNSMGYQKLKENLYFESQFPRYNAFVNLKEFNVKRLHKNTRNKIRKADRKGLYVELGKMEDLELLSKFTNRDEFYYTDLYNVFKKDDNVDIFLVKVNYEKYLINSQSLYIEETERNQILNERIVNNPSSRRINKKMQSDIKMLNYKNDIMEATKMMKEDRKEVIAIALVNKHNKMVRILASGYNKSFKRFVPNYFLFYHIIRYYKDDYNLLDLNGISGDFSAKSKYKGLNEFKFGFNPKLYEFIGEFDLVIERKAYEYMLKKRLLHKEFKKQHYY